MDNSLDSANPSASQIAKRKGLTKEAGNQYAFLGAKHAYCEPAIWDLNADSHHQARHHLSLQAAGRIRRAPLDAAATRRQRPESVEIRYRHYARAEPDRLDAGPLRQSRRDCELLEARHGTSI